LQPRQRTTDRLQRTMQVPRGGAEVALFHHGDEDAVVVEAGHVHSPDFRDDDFIFARILSIRCEAKNALHAGRRGPIRRHPWPPGFLPSSTAPTPASAQTIR